MLQRINIISYIEGVASEFEVNWVPIVYCTYSTTGKNVNFSCNFGWGPVDETQKKKRKKQAQHIRPPLPYILQPCRLLAQRNQCPLKVWILKFECSLGLSLRPLCGQGGSECSAEVERFTRRSHDYYWVIPYQINGKKVVTPRIFTKFDVHRTLDERMQMLKF